MLIDRIKDEAIVELVTVRDFIRWSTSQFYAAELFFGHGTDNAWDEAVALILFALHLPPSIGKEILDSRLTLRERQRIIALITRRVKERLPAAYIMQEAWFAGLKFHVDERVLVPRSAIAELIEREFDSWISEEKVERVLDLCTGSGCIAIACAHVFQDAVIDASDISADALAVAKLNVEKYKLESQVNLLQSNLFRSIPKENKYDIIVSNPPYVSEAEMVELPAEYNHEPALGLVAGKEGLDVVIEILQQASKYLTSHGILIVEVGNSEQALIERFPDVPFTWLEFQRGDGGVFLLTAEQLANYKFS